MKKVILAVIVIVAIIGAWLAFGGKNDSTSTNTKPATNNNQPSRRKDNTQNQPSQTQPTSSEQVTISNFAFSPMDITVKKGAKVTWTNQDSTNHDVKETDGKNGPSSSTLSNGQSYSFTFNEVGTFHYHCSIHPDMTGTVTVTE